jgi:hypothetical protein
MKSISVNPLLDKTVFGQERGVILEKSKTVT